MNRRSLLKGAMGAAGAAVGAFALRSGVDARESALAGVQGQQVNALMSLATQGEAHYVASVDSTLVTGPDPDTMVHIRFDEAENATVVPPGMETPNEMARTWAIPRTLFPEYDPTHGIVPLPMFRWPHSGDDDLALLLAAYQHALGQRTPDRPLDGNHLAVRFMPRTMIDVAAYLDGVKVPGVTESYSGPDGWLVQMVGTTDERGRYQPTLFGDSLRSRIVTGNVELRIGEAIVWPGDHTAPLLP